MPRPLDERQSLEQELTEELPAQLAAYRHELTAGHPGPQRREWLEWHIRRVEKRRANVLARLEAMAEGRTLKGWPSLTG